MWGQPQLPKTTHLLATNSTTLLLLSCAAGRKGSYAGPDVALVAAILATATMETSPVPGSPMEMEDIADHEEHNGNTSLPLQV